MTATAAVPTASLKSVFSLLNDWFPIFGARSDGLLSAKSKGRFRLSDGRLAILVNGRYQSVPDLEIHIPIIHICWRGWRRDGAIQARSLLNLLRVAVHNQIPQIVQNLKYRQGLGGRPMRWQLPHRGMVAFFL
jgi:hypothetical protein